MRSDFWHTKTPQKVFEITVLVHATKLHPHDRNAQSRNVRLSLTLCNQAPLHLFSQAVRTNVFAKTIDLNN